MFDMILAWQSSSKISKRRAQDFRREADFDFVDPKRLAAVIDGLQGDLCKVLDRGRKRGDYQLARLSPASWAARTCGMSRHSPRIACAWASTWTPCPRPRPPWSRARSATRRHPRSVTSATSLATSGSLTTRRRWSTTRGDSRLRTCAYAAATPGMLRTRMALTGTLKRTSSGAG